MVAAMRRDDPDVFDAEGHGPPELTHEASKVIEVLGGMVTPKRLARIREVVARRTYRATLLLEDITDPHNTSAVLRSCDAFGVQAVHVVAGKRGFQAARAISKGAHRWLDVIRHDTGPDAVRALQADGFVVLAASMEGDVRPEALAHTPKVAIVMGNEHRGPTKETRALVDGTFAIPMRGFSDSLNVSVAAAITLFAATSGHESELTESERDDLVARYLMHSVNDPDTVLADAIAE